MSLPVVRVDNWLLFPGGFSRQMTLRERLMWRFGQRKISE